MGKSYAAGVRDLSGKTVNLTITVGIVLPVLLVAGKVLNRATDQDKMLRRRHPGGVCSGVPM